MDAPSPLCQVSSHQTKELVTRVTCEEEHVTESTGTQTWISPSVRTLSSAKRRCWTLSTRPPSCPRHRMSCRSERERPRPRGRRGDHLHPGQARARGERSPSPRGCRSCCSVDLQRKIKIMKDFTRFFNKKWHIIMFCTFYVFSFSNLLTRSP